MMNKHEELIGFIAKKRMNKIEKEKGEEVHKDKMDESDIIGKIQRWDWREEKNSQEESRISEAK
jgi:hypothetical protein